jgi:3-deoxy-D-manno-octulosonic-acid transferase
MNLLYNLGIFLFKILIQVAGLFNEKARLFIKGRKGWKVVFSEKIDRTYQYIWFHCASLGEFEQGRPVIEEVKKRFSEYKILLTFFSPSGYEVRKNYSGADIVCIYRLILQKMPGHFMN